MDKVYAVWGVDGTYDFIAGIYKTKRRADIERLKLKQEEEAEDDNFVYVVREYEVKE